MGSFIDDYMDVQYEGGRNSDRLAHIFINGCDKYHDYEWTDLFDKIKDICLEGEADFAGEDGEHWRFIFRDGKWVEENGEICYEGDKPEEKGISRDRVIQILQKFIEAEAKCNLSTSDMRLILVLICDVKADEVKELGLEWLFPEVKERKEG